MSVEYCLGYSYHLYECFIFLFMSLQMISILYMQSGVTVWKKRPEQTHSANMLVLNFTRYKQTLKFDPLTPLCFSGEHGHVITRDVLPHAV